MAQVHPKTDPQTAQETGVTARLSARDAENAKPHTATNVDVPVKEVHRYRPDFFGDYMGWLNYKDTAVRMASLSWLILVIPAAVLVLLITLSISPKSSRFVFDSTLPLSIAGEASCRYSFVSAGNADTSGDITALVVLGSSQLEAQAEGNSLSITRTAHAYQPAELRTVGEECWIIFSVGSGASSFPDVNMQLQTPSRETGRLLNGVFVSEASMASLNVTSPRGSVNMELKATTFTSGGIALAADSAHLVGADVVFSGSAPTVSVIMRSGTFLLSSNNSANISLTWPNSSNETIESIDGHVCVSGPAVACSGVAGNDDNDCVEFSVSANATASTLAPVHVAATWHASTGLAATLDSQAPATPRFGWTSLGAAYTESWQGQVQATPAHFPGFRLDAEAVAQVSAAVAADFEVIQVHVTGHSIAHSEWVLLDPNDVFSSKMEAPTLDMLSFGAINYRVFKVFVAVSPDLCPGVSQPEDVEYVVAAIFMQLAAAAGDRTVYFRDAPTGKLKTYLQPPQTPALQLRSTSLEDDSTMLWLIVLLCSCTAATGIFGALTVSDEVKEITANAIFRFYHNARLVYRLREDECENGAAEALTEAVATRARSRQSLLNDAEQDGDDCGVLLLAALATHDNNLFANFVHRYVWKDWQFAKPFYWHVGAALRSMRACPEADAHHDFVDMFLSKIAFAISQAQFAVAATEVAVAAEKEADAHRQLTTRAVQAVEDVTSGKNKFDLAQQVEASRKAEEAANSAASLSDQAVDAAIESAMDAELMLSTADTAPQSQRAKLSSVLRLPDVQNVLEVAAAAKNASNPARSDIVAKHALLQAASLTPLKPDLDWETFRLTILVLFHSGLWRRFADVKQAEHLRRGARHSVTAMKAEAFRMYIRSLREVDPRMANELTKELFQDAEQQPGCPFTLAAAALSQKMIINRELDFNTPGNRTVKGARAWGTLWVYIGIVLVPTTPVWCWTVRMKIDPWSFQHFADSVLASETLGAADESDAVSPTLVAFILITVVYVGFMAVYGAAFSLVGVHQFVTTEELPPSCTSNSLDVASRSTFEFLCRRFSMTMLFSYVAFAVAILTLNVMWIILAFMTNFNTVMPLVAGILFIAVALYRCWLLFRFIARNPMPSLRTKVWFMTEEERAAERAALDSVPQATRISMSDLSSVLSPLQSYDSGFSARTVILKTSAFILLLAVTVVGYRAQVEYHAASAPSFTSSVTVAGIQAGVFTLGSQLYIIFYSLRVPSTLGVPFLS
eukprot:INCI1487.3.p1 GENE.INCI1487.3~~INCI1487.3.p1  ORF type:complete len:1252 (-),score=200.03 INCI1487.3:24-3779(-)